MDFLWVIVKKMVIFDEIRAVFSVATIVRTLVLYIRTVCSTQKHTDRERRE